MQLRRVEALLQTVPSPVAFDPTAYFFLVSTSRSSCSNLLAFACKYWLYNPRTRPPRRQRRLARCLPEYPYLRRAPPCFQTEQDVVA